MLHSVFFITSPDTINEEEGKYKYHEDDGDDEGGKVT